MRSRSTSKSSLAALAVVFFGALGCAAGSVPPPEVPAQPAEAPPPRAPASDPFALTPPVRDEVLPLLKQPIISPAKTVLGPMPPGLPPPPAECATFAARKPAGACPTGDVLALLDKALTEPDVDKRDRMLADLEPCTGLPVGFARALRGEFAPTVCGEAIQGALLAQPPATITPAVYHALLGQAVASRLARAGTAPPKLAPPYDKQRVLDFTKGPMLTWFGDQARIVQEVAKAASELPYYAGAIAAIEAGMADMRLVEAVRGSPIPDEFAKDAELKNAYYASLDQGLDPRKDRGRDAALHGMKEFALVGALDDRRVGVARAMLSRLYGGRRIDALDVLVFPPAPADKFASTEEQLAAHLPTFYAGVLLDEKAATRPGTMRALATHGVPLPMRAALAKETALAPEVRALYALARLKSGRVYWRAADFDQAAALVSGWPSGTPRPDEITLAFAAALALRGGPEDAADMMRRASVGLSGEPNVAALDAVAAAGSPSPLGGFAAFDAACIRQMLAPQSAPAAYFQDVARRYRDAAARLTDPKTKSLALDRAAAADQIAAAIR